CASACGATASEWCRAASTRGRTRRRPGRGRRCAPSGTWARRRCSSWCSARSSAARGTPCSSRRRAGWRRGARPALRVLRRGERGERAARGGGAPRGRGAVRRVSQRRRGLSRGRRPRRPAVAARGARGGGPGGDGGGTAPGGESRGRSPRAGPARGDGPPRAPGRPGRAGDGARAAGGRRRAACPARSRRPGPRPGALHQRTDGRRDPRLLSRRAVKRVGQRRLVELIRRFGRVRALVVGDLMLDQFVWGTVRRIAPEAPVPVVQVADEDVRPGGAGNVVSNIAALGGRAAVCGIVGRDAAGERLVTALRARRADTRGVVVSRVSPTTQKTRIIAHHQQVVRLDRESGAGPDGAGARHVRDFVLRHRARYDVLVVADYGKGAIGPDLLGALAEASGRAPFTWVLDPKRVNFAHYR